LAKNPRRAAAQRPAASTSSPLFSRRGKKLMAIGGLLVVLGFGVLTATDPAGRNWASHLSPFLLVLGYTLIGFGIVRGDPISNPSAVSSSPLSPK